MRDTPNTALQRTGLRPPLSFETLGRRHLANLLAALFLAAPLTAESPKATAPHLPYLDWGACPFECCTYRAWGVTKPTLVWRERRRDSPVAFRLAEGDRVVCVTGVVVTRKAGRMRVLKELKLDELRPISLMPGDVIYTLHYLGEGYDLFWFNGSTHSDQISAEAVDTGSPAPGAVLWVEALPETDWWVKVKNSAGQVGWTLVDKNFDPADMDACS